MLASHHAASASPMALSASGEIGEAPLNSVVLIVVMAGGRHRLLHRVWLGRWASGAHEPMPMPTPL